MKTQIAFLLFALFVAVYGEAVQNEQAKDIADIQAAKMSDALAMYAMDSANDNSGEDAMVSANDDSGDNAMVSANDDSGDNAMDSANDDSGEDAMMAADPEPRKAWWRR